MAERNAPRIDNDHAVRDTKWPHPRFLESSQPVSFASEKIAMTTKPLYMSSAAAALLAVIACAEKPAEPTPAPAEPAPSVPVAAPAAAENPSTALPAIPEGASVSFIAPADGAKVEGAAVDGKVGVAVKMGATNLTVKPAGQIEAGTGHHHLLIDTTPDPEGAVVAKDEQHQHYGQGETEATLQLTPGEHTLQLQFADGLHRSYGPKLASTIKIIVAESVAKADATADLPKTKSKASLKDEETKSYEAAKAAGKGKKPQAEPKPEVSKSRGKASLEDEETKSYEAAKAAGKSK